MSIRLKLYLAIAGIAAITLLSAVTSGIFYGKATARFEQLVTQQVPQMAAALTLAAQAGDILTQAPALAFVLSTAEQERMRTALLDGFGALEQSITQLPQAAANTDIAASLAAVRQGIATLDEATTQRLATASERHGRAETLAREHAAFLVQAMPLARQRTAQMNDEIRSLSAAGGLTLAACVQQITDIGPKLEDTRATMELVALVNQGVGFLAVAAQAENLQQIADLRAKYTPLARSARDIADTALEGPSGMRLRQQTRLLMALGEGEKSLFALRSDELRQQQQAAAILAEQRLVVQGLVNGAGALAMRSRQETDASSAIAFTAIHGATLLQAGLALLSLIAAGLIAWLFIGRRVIAPLLEITAVMQRLTRQDWHATVTIGERHDEIGDMARMVQNFRQNGLDNMRLQKEVEESQAHFAAQRQNQETLLERAVGDVVAAAVAGNLTRRIATQELDGVMQRLGEGVNALLAALQLALGELNRVLDGIAHGDLTRRVEGRFEGVFAELQGNVNSMAARLAEMVGQIADTAENVRDAANEIAAGSNDLAGRTERQAASLEETAASMHQITVTVRQNAANSAAASLLADAARGSADSGGSIAAEAVRAMGAIEDDARRIAEIIGLIDEIAFQTNLLALNASVEAARAGEAGKGFAVVAQEVRALAGRSALASKNIKELIQSSHGKVRNGADLVQKAGAALAEIVVAVKKVADIVAEISAASQEQATGLDDVNSAIGTMDETTQRNGALVEQSTAATQALADEARNLHHTISFFRITPGGKSP